MAFDIDIDIETSDRLKEMGATINGYTIERLIRTQYKVD
jgi:hypothetical protein